MPKAFDKCMEMGGKIRTKTIDKNHYMHICILNGKTYSGEVKVKKATLDKK